MKNFKIIFTNGNSLQISADSCSLTGHKMKRFGALFLYKLRFFRGNLCFAEFNFDNIAGAVELHEDAGDRI